MVLSSGSTINQTAVEYDVIVVGTGHAGCEAALAAARMGCRTIAFTLNLDSTALMPCNPSIGGPGKAHLVREVDALGGEMGRNTDRTSIQIRMLNTSKGPAVQALRAQADKHAYAQSMKSVLEEQDNLIVKQAPVDDLLIEMEQGTPRVAGIITAAGVTYRAKTVVLTTGTFLKGRIIIGDASYPAGRAGEFPADALSTSLARLDFRLGRLKTGTPPRVDARTIDFAGTSVQTGSDVPLFFSDDARVAHRLGRMATPTGQSPIADFREYPPPISQLWREQLSCHLVQTTPETHAIIRNNLHRAPMYNGGISSTGPRYCPSIETKIVRFAEKSSHLLFLEPEGWKTREVYVQGANTSLPEDVQVDFLRSIPALARCEVMRPGYAIEYDYLPGTQVYHTLETKAVRNLYLAGQIIGTTGYEEAAALGLMAGINAARRVQGRREVVLGREAAYIGVLIDDLVTKEMDEPYRMHTSQAEYRLLLRQDNAEERLGGLAYDLGLIDESRYRRLKARADAIESIVSGLDSTWIKFDAETSARLDAMGCKPAKQNVSARDFLCRTDVRVEMLQELGLVAAGVPSEIAREVETCVKYAGYVARQAGEVKRLQRLEERSIPQDLDWDRVGGLRSESKDRLSKVKPRTIGHASRIAGVTASDISVLLVHLEKLRRSSLPR